MATKTTKSPIKKLSKRPKRVKMLVYSEPGGGKSVFAGSSAEVGSTLILNGDGPDGPESMRSFGYDPDIWDVNSYRDLDKAYEYLKHHASEYEFVWFDGVTLFQESNLQFILAEVVKGKPHRDPDVPDKPEYLREQTKTLKTIRHLRALPINFGITAHVMRIEDDEGEVMDLPSIQGKQGVVASKVCGYMSVVGRLEVVQVKKDGKKKRQRRMITEFDGRHYAKDRFNVLNPYVAAPNMAKVMDLISNGRSK
jgi:AAA domain